MSKPKEVRNCANPSCGNKAIKQRTLCGTCRQRKYKRDNAARASYINLRYHASCRGVSFSLTFKGFKETIEGTDYLLRSGPGNKDLQIDRILPELGYTDGNCQVLTGEQNKRKRWKDERVWSNKKYDHETAKQLAGTPF